jgi:thioredoxin 2
MKVIESVFDADRDGLLSSCPSCGKRNRLPYDRLGKTFRCGNCHHQLAPPSEPIEIGDEEVFEALTQRAALPILVDFWAPWCGPCKMVAPEVSKAAAEAAGRWLAVKVNTEELPLLAQRFQISAIPLMVVFKNGREIARQAGAMPAQQIRSFVEQAL